MAAAKETEPKTYKITLPLTRERQNDVFVSLNGENFKIQRGVEVEVSEGIYEVLKNSEAMDELALREMMNLPHKS